MLSISQIKLPRGSGAEVLEGRVRKLLRLRQGDKMEWRVGRHSIDARKKPDIYDVYTVEVSLGDGAAERRTAARLQREHVAYFEEVKYRFPAGGPLAGTIPAELPERNDGFRRPIVVGAGPAGLFCALLLAQNGFRPLLLERGAPMEERIADVERFWRTGELDPLSNIQFGEGGAGTFSDGKLTTNVKDRMGRHALVLETFIAAGAPESIACEQYPHIGTDKLRDVIINIRKEIEELGGEVLFHAQMTELLAEDGRVTGVRVRREAAGGLLETVIPAEAVVLAPGHSARDTMRMLHDKNVPMKQKNFAVGFRVSHPQSMIDERMYGVLSGEEKRRMALPPCSYKLTAQLPSGRGVYSFCMCPGGYIVNASSGERQLVVNGMSNSARDAARANSAIVMTVGEREFGSDDVFAGLRFQERLEEKAYRLAGGRIPVEQFATFRRGAETEGAEELRQVGGGKVQAPGELRRTGGADAGAQELTEAEREALCLKGRAAFAPLHTLLPEDLTADFLAGMERFERTIPGFTGSEAYVCGLESRTSSPVRILRGEDFQSELRGLFPCGEGAGFAGGIVSAAIDGIKAAEAVAAWHISRYAGVKPQTL